MQTGMDLKLARVAARVKSTELARAMGVSVSRITRIEAQPTVTERLAERYMTALEAVRQAKAA